jgi:hypothetical protein
MDYPSIPDRKLATATIFVMQEFFQLHCGLQSPKSWRTASAQVPTAGVESLAKTMTQDQDQASPAYSEQSSNLPG